MEVILGGRQSGKTQKLIQEFLKDPENSVILTCNELMAQDLRRRLLEADPALDGHMLMNNVVSVASNIHLRGSRRDILIDNADILLQMLYGDVRLATWTVEGGTLEWHA